MIYFSDSQATASGFAAPIEEFRSVFRSNDVTFGTPDDFFQFSRALTRNPQLSEDLSVVAKSVLANENSLSLRTLLTIIAVASGGAEIANSDRDLSRSVDRVIDFLIHVGGCSQISSENPDSPCSEPVGHDVEAFPPDHASLQSSEFSLDENEGENGDENGMDASQTGLLTLLNEEQISYAAGDVSAPSDLKSGDKFTESLSRIEFNSLQVKLYLDSIDQRISRMEPRLEGAPSLAYSPSIPQTRDPQHDPEAKFSAAIASPASPLPASSLPAPTQTGPDLPHHDSASPVAPSDEPPPQPGSEPNNSLRPRLPLWAAYRHALFSRSRIALPTVLFCLALFTAAALYWTLGRDTTETTAPLNVALNPGPPSTPDHASAPASAARHAPANTPSSLETDTAPGTIAARALDHPLSRPPAQPSSAPPSLRAHVSAIPPGASIVETSSTSPLATPALTHDSRSSFAVLSSHRVNVSSGVMAANLLESPAPAYPRLASLTHMQGNVVMQAIISRQGTVESLHVIKGHHLLRNAAANAVRTWRYRPYLINGRPVEVATIVSVEFTLGH